MRTVSSISSADFLENRYTSSRGAKNGTAAAATAATLAPATYGSAPPAHPSLYSPHSQQASTSFCVTAQGEAYWGLHVPLML